MPQSDATASNLSTKIIGRKIIRYKCVASTNDLCFDLAKENEEGLVVIADEQSSGRGRFNRNWFSPPGGGLYFSILLRPPGSYNLPFLSLSSSLAVANALRKLKLDVFIKWPNDVLIGLKKISGILAEKRNEALVVGIGINVNNEKQYFPDEIKEKATSLKIETGNPSDKLKIFISVLEEFDRTYLMYLNQENKEILNEIKEFSCVLGRKIKIKDNTSIFEGEAVDIASDGALIMRDINDKIIKIYSGEIINGYKRSAGRNNC